MDTKLLRFAYATLVMKRRWGHDAEATRHPLDAVDARAQTEQGASRMPLATPTDGELPVDTSLDLVLPMMELVLETRMQSHRRERHAGEQVIQEMREFARENSVLRELVGAFSGLLLQGAQEIADAAVLSAASDVLVMLCFRRCLTHPGMPAEFRPTPECEDILEMLVCVLVDHFVNVSHRDLMWLSHTVDIILTSLHAFYWGTNGEAGSDSFSFPNHNMEALDPSDFRYVYSWLTALADGYHRTV